MTLKKIIPNFGKLILKWYIEYWTYILFKMYNLEDNLNLKKNIKMNLEFFSEYY